MGNKKFKTMNHPNFLNSMSTAEMVLLIYLLYVLIPSIFSFFFYKIGYHRGKSAGKKEK